jgi:hypothetical protein
MKYACSALFLALSVAGCGESPAGVPGLIDPQDSAAQTVPVDSWRHSGHHAQQPRATKTAEYFGGPIVPNAKVYVTFWGDEANINSSITASRGGIADFFTGVLNSNFVDWLNEYSTNIPTDAGSNRGKAGTGQFIGRGNVAGTRTLTNIPRGNVTDDQIQATLDRAFGDGTLPEPDENTLYAIYFPPGVTITQGGAPSCLAFGAYHNNTTETTRPNAFYLVMPDCGDSFRGVTLVTSHELAEAITDPLPAPGANPDFPQAWNDSGGNEVGDLCEGTSGTVSTSLGSFTVQGIWDERSGRCTALPTRQKDFRLTLAQTSLTLAHGQSNTITVQTAVVAGGAQSLTLDVKTPAGVTASLSSATTMSGGSVTLTLTADAGAALTDAQVVVRADGQGDTGAQSHSAAVLLQVH